MMATNTNGNGKIVVTFLHPRDSREFKAELGPAATGAKAIEGLVTAEFIEPPGADRTYALKHAGKTIPLSASLAASGVQSGDTVAVIEGSAGA